MKMFRSIAAVGMAVAVAALTACAGTGDGGAGGATGGGGGDDKLTVGFVAFHFDSYFSSVQAGVEKALGDDGEVIAVSFDDDAGKETQAYQDLISRQVDVILTSPFDPEGSVAGLQAAVDAGIPVVCYNTCVAPEHQKGLISGFVQSDNTSLGTLSGEYAATYINDNLNGKATIGILNCDEFDVCKLRKKGFLDALEAGGVDVEVVADQTSYIADQTVAAAESILTANPGINVMWSATDGGGSGEVSAIQGANLAGKVVVFSTDMSLALADALKGDDGILLGTTGQDGVGQGAALIDIAKEAKPGEAADPFETFIPGILYSVDDLKTVDAWVEANS